MMRRVPCNRDALHPVVTLWNSARLSQAILNVTRANLSFDSERIELHVYNTYIYIYIYIHQVFIYIYIYIYLHTGFESRRALFRTATLHATDVCELAGRGARSQVGAGVPRASQRHLGFCARFSRIFHRDIPYIYIYIYIYI